MRLVKVLLIALVTLFFMDDANAQTSKSKTKSKEVAAKKYQCPMKCEGDKTYAKTGKCPECGMTMKVWQPAAEAYQCTMKCEGDKTYDKPGKCRVCNMTMVRASANEEEVKPARKKKVISQQII